MLADQAFKPHVAGGAEEIGTDLALFERPDIFSTVKRPHQADPRQHRRAAVFGNKHQRPCSMESKGWI